jgi:hypothetical protein
MIAFSKNLKSKKSQKNRKNRKNKKRQNKLKNPRKARIKILNFHER